jgi:hypothetical protein
MQMHNYSFAQMWNIKRREPWLIHQNLAIIKAVH